MAAAPYRGNGRSGPGHLVLLVVLLVRRRGRRGSVRWRAAPPLALEGAPSKVHAEQ
jgi:hypothetical protein